MVFFQAGFRDADYFAYKIMLPLLLKSVGYFSLNFDTVLLLRNRLSHLNEF